MEMHELEVAIQPDGTVKIHVKGTKGPVCEKYVEFFEQVLNSTAEVERTSEYYEPPSDVTVDLENRL